MSTREQGFTAPKEQPELSLVQIEEEPSRRNMAELPGLAAELSALDETQSNLEKTLVGGFQTMVDKFGARRVVDTLLRHDVPSMVEVIDTLAPTDDEKRQLFEAMRTTSLETTFAEMNDKAGGSQNFSALDQAELFRDAEVASLERGDPTTSSDYLMSGFSQAVQLNPELVESFVETGDAASLLGHIRGVQVEALGDFADARAEVLHNAEAERDRAHEEIKLAQDEIEAQYAEVIERIEASLASAQTQGNQYAVDSNNIALAHQQYSLEQNRARFNSSRAEADARLREQASMVDQLKVNQLFTPTPMTNSEGLILEMQDGNAVGRAHDSYAA